jgi:hypothetical protein
LLKTPAIVVVVGLDVVVVVVVKKMISFAVYFTYCAMRSLSGCNCVSTSIKVESSNSKTLGGTPHFSSWALSRKGPQCSSHQCILMASVHCSSIDDGIAVMWYWTASQWTKGLLTEENTCL